MYPPKTWSGFLRPLLIELTTEFTSMQGARFKNCSTVRYDRGPKRAKTVHVSAVA
jgi:hypothetical protein